MTTEIRNSLIIVPEILDSDALNVLSRNEKSEYIKKVILMILYENRKRRIGILESELNENLDYPESAIKRAINTLLQLREIYSLVHKNRKYLYLNGKIAHKIIGNDILLGDKRYIFKIIANSRRKAHLFIQEKSIDFFGGHHNKGAIMVSIDDLDDFLRYLNEISEEAKELNKKLEEGKTKVMQ